MSQSMTPRRGLAVLAALSAPLFAVLLFACTTSQAPATWDHLVRVPKSTLESVYLLPGADFRGYTKILLDPVQVAFAKNWQRDINDSALDLSRRVSDEDAARILEDTRNGATKIFTDAFHNAGYELVTVPGADVLRVSPNIIDLYITAPQATTPGRSRTYAVDAGEATLAIEARDSTTGAVLGRALDHETAGIGTTRLSRMSDVFTTADFERLYRRWADVSVKGLAELKARSPLVLSAPPATAAAAH